MAIDFHKTVWIVAAQQGDRLGVLGGTNSEPEARQAAALFHGSVLLRAEVVNLDQADEADQ